MRQWNHADYILDLVHHNWFPIADEFYNNNTVIVLLSILSFATDTGTLSLIFTNNK